MSTLDELYRQIPSVNCKGLCHGACGPIPCTTAEADRMAKESWSMHEPEDGMCPYLHAARCTVYEARPLVCRLYGATPAMACPHGCSPTVSERKAERLVREVSAVGGPIVLLGELTRDIWR